MADVGDESNTSNMLMARSIDRAGCFMGTDSWFVAVSTDLPVPIGLADEIPVLPTDECSPEYV